MTASEESRVFANFLLSPEAQARKGDITIWGDGCVLDQSRLTEAQRAAMNKPAPGALNESTATLAEPHASWVEALETEWLRRYGTR